MAKGIFADARDALPALFRIEQEAQELRERTDALHKITSDLLIAFAPADAATSFEQFGEEVLRRTDLIRLRIEQVRRQLSRLLP